mgnify:FL=1
MSRILILLLALVWSVFKTEAQTVFSKNLKAGKDQTVVFYGSSAAINHSNRFWVDQLQQRLDKKFPGKVDFYNCSKSGIGSFWATENFKDSVLSRKPDLLVFGFSENDAVLRFNNWPWYSGRCAEYMIDHLREQNKDATIILYILSEHPLGSAAETRPEIAAFNTSCREVALKKNIILVDFSIPFNEVYDQSGEEGLKQYQRDGILPTKKAATEVLVPMLWKAIFGSK